MAEDLYVEEGEDDNLWIMSHRFGTAVAVCKEVDGKWFAAEDDSFSDKTELFSTLDELVDHVEKHRLFDPWGSPGM